MKIYVNRVPDEGLRTETTYDPATMDMERPDMRLASPISVAVVARHEEQELLVEASIHCVLECTCARCLTCFESVIKKQALFNYDVSNRLVVDITDDVREEIMLDYPMVPVCEEECRGLCARCGQNLNDGDCAHQLGVEDDQGAE